MIIFNGYQVAAQHEADLTVKVSQLHQQGIRPHIAAILFEEDAGSQLYTRLKREAAQRVGIEYDMYSFSLHEELQVVLKKLQELNQDSAVTGIIIQKPSKQKWSEVVMASAESDVAALQFAKWWEQLVTQIDLHKDVDGLHPQTLAAVQAGTWEDQGLVLPATAKAVLEIVRLAAFETAPELPFAAFLDGLPAVVIGKSDIVGKPLFYALMHKKCKVEMIGTKELKDKIEQNEYLKGYRLVISSTGRPEVVTEEMLGENVILIDVGEPRGDVNREGLETKVSFLTPVPGGVGPMTVVSLLENAVALLTRSNL